MGMSYGVYIGPFLHCKGNTDLYIGELTDDRLTGLRGELSSDDPEDEHYFGPNIEAPGLEREMRFSGHDLSPVVMRIDQQAEVAAFIDYFNADITLLRNHYESVSVEWGVVPEYS